MIKRKKEIDNIDIQDKVLIVFGLNGVFSYSVNELRNKNIEIDTTLYIGNLKLLSSNIKENKKIVENIFNFFYIDKKHIMMKINKITNKKIEISYE